MAVWTTIPNTAIAQDKPIKAETGLALRDNVTAAMEGASGAPALLDPALGPTATTDGRDWVNARIALSVNGAVGTYAMLYHDNTGVAIGPGTNVAGSNLRYSDANNTVGATPAGTWKCMGNAGYDGSFDAYATLYVRIS